jgi:hypothetical protein
MALAEPIPPTFNLSATPTNVAFGAITKTVTANFSYTINTMGATVASVLLEWRRNNTGGWTTLSTNTGIVTYPHSIDDSGNRFNATVINYRYTVTDTASATLTVTYDVTPQAYAAPTISPTYSAGTTSYQTELIRESGNVNTVVAGSISSNRSLVNITGYIIERNVDGAGYTTIQTITGLSSLTPPITSYLDSGVASTASSILYRITVTDEYTTNSGSVHSIVLRFASYYGYNTNGVSLTGPEILALGNQLLLTSRVRTMVLTAGMSEYTYLSYPALFGDLTSAIMDCVTPVLGAFTKLANVSVSNNYGASVSNIVYVSNSPGAFVGNSVAFS